MADIKETIGNLPFKEILEHYGYLTDKKYSGSIGLERLSKLDELFKDLHTRRFFDDPRERDSGLRERLRTLLRKPTSDQLTVVMAGTLHLASMTEVLRDTNFLPMIMPRDGMDEKIGGLLYTLREFFYMDKVALRRKYQKGEMEEVGIPAICIPDSHGKEYSVIFPDVVHLNNVGIKEINFYPEHGKKDILNTVSKLQAFPWYRKVGNWLNECEEADIKVNIFGFEI
jgi:hypothetical protein